MGYSGAYGFSNKVNLDGLLEFRGGYDANTNTPDLITSPNAIQRGDFYAVTFAGVAFFGVMLEPGDSLFAQVNSPSVVTDWVIIQGNTVYATEIVAGVIKLTTQALIDAKVDDLTAVTPLKLANADYLPHKYTSPSTAVGSATPVTITHNLNNINPIVSIKRAGVIVTYSVDNFTANTFDITKNGANVNVIVSVTG